MSARLQLLLQSRVEFFKILNFVFIFSFVLVIFCLVFKIVGLQPIFLSNGWNDSEVSLLKSYSGYVFPLVISPCFRMWQRKHDDHQEDAPHFTFVSSQWHLVFVAALFQYHFRVLYLFDEVFHSSDVSYLNESKVLTSHVLSLPSFLVSPAWSFFIMYII